MASQISNNRVLISKIAETSAPEQSHFRTVSLKESAPILKDGEVFVKNLALSLDPYIRHDFSDGKEETIVAGFGIARVIDSKVPRIPVGSLVFCSTNWEEYSHIYQPEYINDFRVIDEPIDSRIPLTAYNGLLGIFGFTVWDSFKQIGDLKAGETIYISSAAGTLGQFAGQLAKRKGLRVIGSAGTDEKVAFLKNELGFDAAFNYKTQDKRAALTEAVGSAGLDIYYDLVGDDTVEIALDLLNPHGRVIAIGTVAGLHGEPYLPKNLINILYKQLRYEGYLVFDNYHKLGEFWTEITPLVANGEIKFKETVIKAGVDTIADTYVKVLSGAYFGKVSIQLADA